MTDYPLYVPVEFPGGLKYEQPTGIFINNEFVKSKQNSVFETISPITEKAIASVYEANEDDVDAAVQLAKKAFEESDWNKADPATRALALNKLADAMEENAEIIAHIDTLDNGKSISNSRGDIALAVSCLRSDASYADKQSGEVVETGNTHFSVTRKEPLGVCGQIIPWNFPILMFSWKIGPALATGNTVVLKTSETTPLSALFVCKLIKERKIFPPGVLNVVNGFGKNTGNAITEHPDIQKVAFTGSTPVGKMIYKKCSDTLKKCTLELGGKSAHIVFDDANFDTAVESVVSGIFFNSGEVCSAGSRLYIQEGVYDKFIEKFVDYTKNQVVVGDPFDEKTLQGAQNSESQLKKILDYVKIGTDEGAKLLSGGEKLPQKGFFVKPTIFGDVKEDMRIVKEEIFGPVITVSKFKTADEVVKMANASEYGLAAGIQSSNINTILNVSRKLKAGTVWVNTYNDFHPLVPFGGYDQSGIGRELGSQVYDNYIQTKSVRIKLEGVN